MQKGSGNAMKKERGTKHRFHMKTADTDRLPNHAQWKRSGPPICEQSCLSAF